MSLLFIPIYIHFMGIESYGLVGIFATLQGLFGLLDMGLSSTLNREIARLSVQDDKAQDMRDLVRTMEIPYWIVGVLIAVSMVMLSPLIAHHWVKVKNLSPRSVQTTILLMGLCAAFQWPISFYSGGLMGLQRQLLLNGINIVIITFRGLGAVVILWLISPTAVAFFMWQATVSAAQVGVVTNALWRSLPLTKEASHFRPELFKNIWRFAAGMTAITIVTTILLQLDKIILSRILSLEKFGYYVLASVVSMSLYRIIGPIFESIYPQFTKFVELGNTVDLAKLYHKSSQLVSVLIFPLALLMIFFSKEILLLWTRNSVTSENAYMVMSILSIGTVIHCLVHVPYALQLAYGWTRLTLLVNVFSALLLVPLMIFFTRRYGISGAASIWVILNIGYMFITIPVMHLHLLSAEKWTWFLQDIGRPLVPAVVVILTGRLIVRPDWPAMRIFIALAILCLAAFLASACAANKLDITKRLKIIIKKPVV